MDLPSYLVICYYANFFFQQILTCWDLCRYGKFTKRTNLLFLCIINALGDRNVSDWHR